jgi:hypothetical protein
MPTSSTNAASQLQNERLKLLMADVCFEMFSVKELRRPQTVIRELTLCFPEASSTQIEQAISLALSWRTALSGVSGMVH